MLFKRKAPPLLMERTKAVINVERRLFMRQSLSLGALALLSGCDFRSETDEASISDRILNAMSQWNDKAQAALFDPTKLAPTFSEADIKDPFPFNAYYGEDEVRTVEEAGWKLQLSGMIAKKDSWTLAQLKALPQESQITRHICVEGWSAIGKWGGAPLGEFLKMVGADTSAKYVGFKCADDYHTSIDMATAMHPQTIIATTFRDQPLPPKFGFPIKIRIPTKLGFKNPKHVMEMFVTNDYPGGYWEDQGYNWFSGA
jgi:DMSO/TMAO reductase YedYZ molybdopterin-dependent catalytic subunit